jgi:hypothetical protein
MHVSLVHDEMSDVSSLCDPLASTTPSSKEIAKGEPFHPANCALIHKARLSTPPKPVILGLPTAGH